MATRPNRLAEAPEPARALYNQAVARWERGDAKAAAEALDAALRLRPDYAEALGFGAFLLERSGRLEPAIRFYRRAVELNPSRETIWSNLGKLLFRLERFEEALAAFDAALRVSPNLADAHNSRASALRSLGRMEASALAARAALARRPDFPEANVNLGTALLKLGHPEEALLAYHAALRARSDYSDALCGSALCLRALDRVEDARAAFARAEALGSREAISGRGCLDLMQGDFENGWAGYEARWISGKSLADALGVRFPRWAGPGRAGERVLALNDHGLGDTIQFARYLPLMLRAGAEVTLVCPRRLHALLAPIAGLRLAEFVPEGESFDAQIAISSLPFAFGTRLNTIPAEVPYLAVDAQRKARWRARIGAQGIRIGVVWQGNPNPEADMARSYPLAALAPLVQVAGVRLISLQKGYGVEQLAALSPDVPVETLGEDFDAGADAFLDTAAAMDSLDLVITCDTSIAHLAGALARPTWVALKRDAEWRWMRERETSPWYPSLRLFRQPRAGDWESVFAAMAEALRARAQRARI